MLFYVGIYSFAVATIRIDKTRDKTMNSTVVGLDLSPTSLAKVFFIGVFSGGMGLALASGALTLAPKRALEHPMNMPFGTVRQGKAESPRMRWLLGNVFGLLLTAGAYLGSQTDALPEGYAKDVCSYFFLPWGLLASFLHAQLTWERCNGNQMAKNNTIMICTTAQMVYVYITVPFLINLYQSGDSPITLGLVASSSACILATWGYRLAALRKAGCDTDKFEQQFLCPLGFKKE
mmetsp:Transcript_6752/g.8219  ORF Transcript_6752/g.8219 Transcript_6752/m.8219 type:complete len:234 (-) Transcript_6752:232-933(-)